MASRKLRVKAVADGMIPSVELVLAKPLAWLAERGELEYTLDVISDVDPKADLGSYDLLILMRACMPDALELVESANRQSVPVIYAIDDDFETLDPDTPLGRHYHENRAWPRLLEICQRSQQVWAFSEALRRKIEEVQSRIVIPPAVASIESIDELRAQDSAPSSDATARRRIGYGASWYHSADVDSIAGPLQRLLDEFEDLEIEFIGVAPPSMLGRARVTHFPSLPTIQDYYRFSLSRNWTVGIAPLLRNAANDAKTDNKYREYAALGVPAVYADAPPYWRSVIDGFNGRVARSPDEWYCALKDLLTNATARQEIIAKAREDISDRYGTERVALRYLDLMRSASNPPLRVLVYAADIATTDIDIRRPFGLLTSEGKLEFSVVPYGQQISSSQLEWADILIVSRVHDDLALDVMERARSEPGGVKVVFSWDDDFFSMPESLGALARHHRDPANIRSLESMLRLADLVKASTPLIEQRSLRYNQNVVRAPYGFDFGQLSGQRLTRGHSRDDVVIGFFGTIHHASALESVLSALRVIAERHPQVRFEFFGPRTSALEQLPRATFIPYAPSAEESLKTLASRGWDIGIAPLERNDFNRAKLPTKYRDYGACHIAGIYSRLDPYEDAVTHGVTGLLVGTEQSEWIEALERLVVDAPYRRSMAAHAHAHVRNKLSLEQAVETWRALLDRLAPEQSDSTEQDQKQRRRIQALEARVSYLSRRVDLLRAASQALLHAYEEPLPPAGSWMGRLRRYLFKLIREFGAPFASVAIASPCPAVIDLARRAMPGTSAAGINLTRTPDLRSAPFLEYPMIANGASGTLVRLPTASLVPTLGGHIGIEIVSPTDQIHCHVLVPIEHMDPSQIAVFRVSEFQVNRPGWRMRCFVRNVAGPMHVYLCKQPGGHDAAMLLYTLESEAPGKLPSRTLRTGGAQPDSKPEQKMAGERDRPMASQDRKVG